jgi:hypothetical protein
MLAYAALKHCRLRPGLRARHKLGRQTDNSTSVLTADPDRSYGLLLPVSLPRGLLGKSHSV